MTAECLACGKRCTPLPSGRLENGNLDGQPIDPSKNEQIKRQGELARGERGWTPTMQQMIDDGEAYENEDGEFVLLLQANQLTPTGEI